MLCLSLIVALSHHVEDHEAEIVLEHQDDYISFQREECELREVFLNS